MLKLYYNKTYVKLWKGVNFSEGLKPVTKNNMYMKNDNNPVLQANDVKLDVSNAKIPYYLITPKENFPVKRQNCKLELKYRDNNNYFSISMFFEEEKDYIYNVELTHKGEILSICRVLIQKEGTSLKPFGFGHITKEDYWDILNGDIDSEAKEICLEIIYTLRYNKEVNAIINEINSKDTILVYKNCGF